MHRCVTGNSGVLVDESRVREELPGLVESPERTHMNQGSRGIVRVLDVNRVESVVRTLGALNSRCSRALGVLQEFIHWSPIA